MIEANHAHACRPVPGSIALILFVIAVHVAFARFSVAVPYVFGDEAGYLTKAAVLAGLRTDAYSSYYAGYALLLAPLFAVSPHVLEIFPLIQLLNASLAGIWVWLLLALARMLAPCRSLPRRWLVAGALGCYPSFLAYSSFALSENLFVLLVLWQSYLLLRCIDQGRRRHVCLLVVACAWLMFTHPKGIPVVLALHLAWWLVAPRVPRPERRRVYLSLTLAIALFGVLHVLLERVFRHRMGFYGDGIVGHYPGAKALLDQLRALASTDGVAAFALDILGQMFYLSVASFGVLLLGIAAAVKWVRGRPCGVAGEARPGDRALALFALLALGSTMLMTAFFMWPGDRLDHRMFGRYDEGVVAPLLLMGLIHRSSARAWLVAATAIAVLGGVLLAGWGSSLHGAFVQLNVFGLQLWQLPGVMAVGSRSLDLAAIAVGGTLLTASFGLVARRGCLPIVVMVLFLFCAWQGSVVYLKPESDANARSHRVADYLHARFPALDCVDYDIEHSEYWQRYNDQVTLLPIRMHEIRGVSEAAIERSQAFGRRCSDLVISANPRLGSLYPGATLLMREGGSREWLWSIPRSRIGPAAIRPRSPRGD